MDVVMGGRNTAKGSACVGCLTAILVLFGLGLVAMLWEITPLLVLLIFGGIIGVALWAHFAQVKESNEREAKGKPAAVAELEEFERKKRLAVHAETNRVTYLGGHHAYPTETKGIACFTREFFGFYVDNKRVVEEWPIQTKDFMFSIPLRQIESVACDTTSNLTLGRFLIWGPLSFAMKKQNHYMVINYTTEKGVKNSVTFDCGEEKYQDFLNRLNVARNNAE